MKTFFNKLFVGTCLLFSFICCAQKPQFDSLSAKDFEKLLKENPAVQLVDVRRPEEFEAGHIDKAVLINVQAPDFSSKANASLDQSKPVAVYCRSGKRSKEAANILTKAGFKVFELNSGYLGWVEYSNSKK